MEADEAGTVLRRLQGIAAMRRMRWLPAVEQVFITELVCHTVECAERYAAHLSRTEGATPDVAGIAGRCSCRRPAPVGQKAEQSGCSYTGAVRAFREGFLADREARGLAVPEEWQRRFAAQDAKITSGEWGSPSELVASAFGVIGADGKYTADTDPFGA